MNLVEIVVLALVQGVTEFLPISSSGHLVLTTWLFGWDDPGLTFDVAVHLGTLAAVLVVFRREWIAISTGLFRSNEFFRGTVAQAHTDGLPPRRLLLLIVIGTVPVAIFGLAIRDSLDDTLRNPTWVGGFLISTGVALAIADRYGRKCRTLASLGARDSARIGVVQAIAVLPGISRAGACIVGGMLHDLTREDSARFAFYLAVPAIVGAGLLAAIDLARDETGVGASWGEIVLGTVIAFVTALVVARGLLALLGVHSLRIFVGYCLAVGAAVVIARSAGL